MIELHVDRGEPLPLHVQLSEQMRYHIEVGAWEPGYRLPTVRFLAGSLGVNYGTVRAVYTELEREGFVVTQQGRGTFVTGHPPRSRDLGLRVETLIDGALIDADRMGVTAEEFARLAYLRAKAFRRKVPGVPVLFIECCSAEVEFHVREIAEAMGGRPPSGLVLDDLPALPDAYFDRFSVIATTMFHIAEVQKALEPRKVHGLLVEPSSSETVARLRPLAKGSRVAIICSTRPMARRMQNALLRVGLTHLKYWSVPIDAPAEVQRAFREADEIFVSRRILSAHRGPWPTKRTFREYVDVLHKESLRFLRRKIAEAVQAERPGRAPRSRAGGKERLMREGSRVGGRTVTVRSAGR